MFVTIKKRMVDIMDYNIFRAYDIRGVYPSTINKDVSYTIGRAYGSYIREKLGKTFCVVSHDNRLSSEELSSFLIKGITESGCNVINYGLTILKIVEIKSCFLIMFFLQWIENQLDVLKN